MKPFKEISIAVCSDHAGFELKNAVLQHLQISEPWSGLWNLFFRVLRLSGLCTSNGTCRGKWNTGLWHSHLRFWKWNQHDSEQTSRHSLCPLLEY